MNPSPLLRICTGLWVAGLAGASFSKGILDLGQGTLPFEIATRMWAVGVLSTCFLLGLALLPRSAEPEEA